MIGLIAPRDERGEAAGLVLKRAQSQQMLDALFVGLHRAVHHRRGRAKAGPVRVPHDVEPLVGGGLAVAVQQRAHAIDENFRAAARHAVEARGNQPIEHLRHRQLRQTRQVDDFGRRQRMQLERRVALLDRAEQILVPRERQVGIVAALQQQLDAADRDGLVDLAEQFVESEDVAFRRSDRTIERAEVALRDADVRVVDVAIDDVADDALGMLPLAHRIRPAVRGARSERRGTTSSASSASMRAPVRTLSAIE